MAAQSLFGFVLLLLLTLQLKTATSEPQFSDTNGFVKLPTELQQKAYKYSQGYQAPPSASSSGSYNEYYTNDIGYSDNNIYNSRGYSDNNIYNSRGYSSDNTIYNSGGYLDNNIYNNFATAVEGGGPLLDQQQILLSQPGPSPCSSPPPLGGNCPVPWIQPQQGFSFNPMAGNCQPVVYNGCGYNGNNYYNSYQSCMGICGNSLQPDYIAPPQQPPIQQQPCDTGCYGNGVSVDLPAPSNFYCYQGMPLSQSLVCDGYPDCPYGEDELNCPNANNGGRSNIIELNDSNFDKTVLSHSRIMVEFYTTTCHVCTEFAREYEQTADQVRLLGIDVAFARVDLGRNLGLKNRFSINTYPRLILWDNQLGYPVPKRYFKKFGLTSTNLAKWIRIQVRLAPSYLPPCHMNEHTCDSGGCVTDVNVCDGSRQCRDGTDETYCISYVDGSTQEITEWSSNPITESPILTTSKPDTETTQRVTTIVCDFQCNDGTCQPNSNRCDGKFDCSDGVDEMSCRPTQCNRDEFTCVSDGYCIDYSMRCDEVRDCQDGSDEDACSGSTCGKNEFICNDGTCIDLDLRCNGRFECSDQSDEINCQERCNLTLQFGCTDGRCIDNRLRCDGVPDCQDRSDEMGCQNLTSGSCDVNSEWECADQRRCIDIRRRCDGYPDCADLSDEDPNICPEVPCVADWQFHCNDRKRCIDRRRQCDGFNDCYDGSDESNCREFVCDYWQLKCESDGICVDNRRRCDGENDCSDGTDEQGCTTDEKTDDQELLEPTTTTPAYTPVVTTTASITTTTTAPSTTERTTTTTPFTTETTTTTTATTTTTSTTSTTTTTTSETTAGEDYDGGWGDLFEATTTAAPTIVPSAGCPTVCTFIYEPVCGTDGKTYANECLLRSASCQAMRGDQPTLTVAYTGECNGDLSPPDFFPEVTEPEVTGPEMAWCTPDQWSCLNGQCIPQSAHCNQVQDCPQGEDELLCDGVEPQPDDETEFICDELDEFTCKNGKCIPASQFCDGVENCDDESDEFDCPTTTTTTTTTSTTTTITTTTSTTTTTTTTVAGPTTTAESLFDYNLEYEYSNGEEESIVVESETGNSVPEYADVNGAGNGSDVAETEVPAKPVVDDEEKKTGEEEEEDEDYEEEEDSWFGRRRR